MLLRSKPPGRARFSTLAAAVGGGVAGGLIFTNFLAVEKKLTHPITVDYGIDDPQFTRSVGLLLGQSLLTGNSVKVLENGDEIFPAMLQAIESSQRTITFENFVFTEGLVSTRFARSLAASARRGVRVHMLQDAVGCNFFPGKQLREIRQAGAEVEIFRFFRLQFNERTHRKLLVIDGQLGFIGGVGISDAWLGDGTRPNRWRDTHYMVKGPVVGQIQQAFVDNWMQTRGCVLHGDDYFPELAVDGNLICQAFQSSSAEGADSARLLFIFSLAAARRSIRIANAYFIPDDLTIRTLLEARERGVDIEVITQGPHCDPPYVRHAGRSRWQSMLENGIRFFEFQPALYHCKYMVIDDRWTCVGSCNFDDRSLRLNEEANLNIYDSEFARRHTELFLRDRDNSREVTLSDWKRRPISERIRGRLGALLKSQL